MIINIESFINAGFPLSVMSCVYKPEQAYITQHMPCDYPQKPHKDSDPLLKA